MSTLLSTEKAGHAFNDKWLFKDVTFGLQKGSRVALVGVNGAGKSTFLKILSGRLVPLEGKVVYTKNVKVEILSQDPEFTEGQTVGDYIYTAGNPKQQIIRAYEEILEQENPDQDEFNHLLDELTTHNAWEYESSIKTVLGQLGITNMQQTVSSLSGGQQKRLALAKVLIEEADVLILDEPTNHLDIETIEWLEKLLSTEGRTLIMVTHDRYFLDNVCNRIIELDQGQLYTYNGNYTYFLEKKEERMAGNDLLVQKSRNLYKKELEWMRRQPQARATKSQARINAFYELEEKTKAQQRNGTVQLDVKMSRQGGTIMELDHIAKFFSNKTLFKNFSYVFKKGDRIGLAGKNGTGKSSLLNIITGKLIPDEGSVTKGETTVIGYYNQQGLSFNPNAKVIDIVKEVAEYIELAKGERLTASEMLNRFLFPPARQQSPVSKLSGGEKKRLHLMRVLMQNPNFLILDEPTNDLDIDTLNVLENFLESYKGVLILVSHDRYLLDKLCDQLFILEGNGSVRVYNGNYSEYRYEQAAATAAAAAQKSGNAQAPKAPEPEKTSGNVKLTYKEKQRLEACESEMHRLEDELAELTLQMNNAGGLSFDKIAQLSDELKQKQEKLDETTLEWFDLNERNA